MDALTEREGSSSEQPQQSASLIEAMSERKLTANLRNAQHSIGPRTPKGTQATRLNALAHGSTRLGDRRAGREQ